MKRLPLISCTCALVFSSALIYAEEVVSPIPQISEEWHFSVSPYGWLPQINTTASNGGPGSKNADISINNLLSNLKSGVMIAGEVHYGKWGVMADLASATLQKYGGFNFQGDPKYRVGDKATLQATLFNFLGAYNVLSSQDAYIDALLGVRWIGLTSTIDLYSGPEKFNSSSATPSTYGIMGLSSRYRIMDSNWFIPLYVDAGTGGGPNHTTWQATAGVGVSLSKMVNVSLTYRALGFIIPNRDGDATLLKGIFHGPQIMGTFNF